MPNRLFEKNEFKINFITNCETGVDDNQNSKYSFYYVYGFNGFRKDYDSLLRFAQTIKFDKNKFQHMAIFIKFDFIIPKNGGKTLPYDLSKCEKYFLLKYNHAKSTNDDSYSFLKNGENINTFGD